MNDRSELYNSILKTHVMGTPYQEQRLHPNFGGDYAMQDLSHMREMLGGDIDEGGRGPSKASKKAAKKNPWLKFLKNFRKKHPHLSTPEAAKQAGKAYRLEHGISKKKAPAKKKAASKKKAPKRKVSGSKTASKKPSLKKRASALKSKKAAPKRRKMKGAGPSDGRLMPFAGELEGGTAGSKGRAGRSAYPEGSKLSAAERKKLVNCMKVIHEILQK